ncbi:MAG: lysophospholipid acyltransferase family protein [Rickettsiales bacterium]|nr:lysophospholipid acyltransferase family protein [Rickettsiales bacterium]
MTKKWKFFGYQTDVEWYDIKTKFKQLLRRITYSWLFQQLICLIVLCYMKLVYHSSKKIFINEEVLIEAVKNKIPLVIPFWHNRLMMIPFVTVKTKKLYHNYNFMTLSSNHGDGRFVGKVMEKIGLISIYGSSKDGRKASRGIDISNLKQIIKGLKNGLSLGITPDGPRGPNQKINGDIINIAKISKAKILPISYSCSKNKRLNSWDKFYIPLPFSKLCFYLDNSFIEVPNNLDEKGEEELKNLIENRMNFVQEESQKQASSLSC